MCRICISCSLLAVLLSSLFTSHNLADEIRIMPLGDSITVGFQGPEPRGSYRMEMQPMLDAVGIEYDFVGDYTKGPGDNNHQGLGGASINRMVLDFGPAVAFHQPDYVLVLAGTNNHFNEPDEQFFIDSYTALFNMIRDNAPESSIIIATVPRFGYDRQPVTSYWTDEFVDERNNVRFPLMNQVIRQVAAEFDRTAVVDLYAVIDIETDLVNDAVHLNLSGQQKLAGLFYDELSSQVFTVPEPASVWLTVVCGMAGLARRNRRSAPRN